MPAALSHFNLSDGTLIDAEVVATDRNWTLYCYDPESRQALFLKLPDSTDLGSSAFSYITQYERAQKAMLVPFDELKHLAAIAPFPENLVMVYSIGRCGSTLVSKIFAEIPNVWSISEPDALTNLAFQRDLFRPEDIPDLIRAGIRLSFRPLAGQNIDTFIVKHRSQLLFFLKPMLQSLPQAKNLFLYRDADGWTQSIYAFAQKQGFEFDQIKKEQLRFLWNILSCDAPESEMLNILGTTKFPTDIEDILAATWIINMNQILQACDGTLSADAFSYSQLNLEREASVARLLSVSDLDPKYLKTAMAAYDEDSQKGTTAARGTPTVPLSGAKRARIVDLLRDHPAMNFHP